jgi:hypothetical protein
MIASARVSGRLAGTTRDALILVGAAAATSAALGALTGLIGAALPAAARVAVFAVLTAALLVAAATRATVWQHDVETPLSWLDDEDWRVVAKNGATLGMGFPTRLGTWLFYLIPLAGMLSGEVAAAALIYLAYGAGRVGLSLATVAQRPRRWLIRRSTAIRTTTRAADPFALGAAAAMALTGALTALL